MRLARDQNGNRYRDTNGSIRLFESDFLEKWITHVHPITPLLVWVPVISMLLWRSFAVHELSLQVVVFLGATGFIFWTFLEYTLHRFLFHFKPKSPTGDNIIYFMHGLHHDDPQDATRLVMPTIPGVLFAWFLFSVFQGVLGGIYVEPFFAFFLMGYLCYDYIHFAVHHFRPRTRVGILLRQHHMAHHFVSPDARWGVSSPLWDQVFKTVEPARGLVRVRSVRAEKARSL